MRGGSRNRFPVSLLSSDRFPDTHSSVVQRISHFHSPSELILCQRQLFRNGYYSRLQVVVHLFRFRQQRPSKSMDKQWGSAPYASQLSFVQHELTRLGTH